MKLIEKLYHDYEEHIRAHEAENRQGALALKANMFRSSLYYKDRYCSKTPQIPKVYDEEMIDRFREIVKTTYGIFEKVIREYLNHADYRALFPFPKEMEELILLPRGYDCLLPIARFDIFYHEDTGEFYFCEINTDGTSAMNEDRLQGKLILDNPAHQAILRKYRLGQFELFDSWVDAFAALYAGYGHLAGVPGICLAFSAEGLSLRGL